jgi:hypothetical protein
MNTVKKLSSNFKKENNLQEFKPEINKILE